MGCTLLRGGTVLIHDADDNVKPTKADVLIEGDRIIKLEPSIAAPAGAETIDCGNKIISPGFVDTHHHMWQSPLKGIFGDMAFTPYMGVSMFPHRCARVEWGVFLTRENSPEGTTVAERR
jgi:cytosine/adenosine deaminase-related metal-dependent hydrolase